MKVKPIKYCSTCGTKLVKKKINANRITVFFGSQTGIVKHKLDKPFDCETGKPNMAIVLTCPNWKHRFLTVDNGHTNIVRYNGVYQNVLKIRKDI